MFLLGALFNKKKGLYMYNYMFGKSCKNRTQDSAGSTRRYPNFKMRPKSWGMSRNTWFGKLLFMQDSWGMFKNTWFGKLLIMQDSLLCYHQSPSPYNTDEILSVKFQGCGV